MTEFRLTQISDTHLSRRIPYFNENFIAWRSTSTVRGQISW